MRNVLAGLALVFSLIALAVAAFDLGNPEVEAEVGRGGNQSAELEEILESLGGIETKVASLSDEVGALRSRVAANAQRLAPRRSQETEAPPKNASQDDGPSLEDFANRLEELERAIRVPALIRFGNRGLSGAEDQPRDPRSEAERREHELERLEKWRALAIGHDTPEEEKLVALRSLRGRRHPDGTDARDHDVVLSMIELARSTEDPRVRADVYRQLSGVTDPDLLPVLYDSVRNDPNVKVREEAAETLEDYLPHPDVEAILREILENDEDHGVRDQAAESLSKRGRKRR